ncbi:bacitracin ABC transporter permease [Staphylococcus microti]|uniref:ABC transporter permease n=1 Tax=Staphylococcus microti TaxID=569857 RepID=A0A0D6XQF2_9STAP|nr:ABC transporter permease [Staphylococcus microti]KIX90675.1 bacitracin ABC transporter permease [Staphylococcus microti]PNZ81764.1 ABC transporter permease [Staphylococcus microti]SUM56746.1 ABC transporter permease [Staphylococcus microti]
MSFNQIIIKNLVQNLKHYAIYLISLIISITMYFSFVTLKYTDEVMASEDAVLLSKAASIGEKFLFIIILFFLMYANRLFIKKRAKSFALFQLVGLSRRDLMRMLGLEQLAIFVTTTLMGIVIGIFGSRLLQLIVKKVLDMPINIKMTIQTEAVLVTLILVACAWLLIMIQSLIFVKRRSIVQLMGDTQQTETAVPRITVSEVIFGMLGVVMIGTGYYLSTIMFANEYMFGLAFIVALAILFLTVLGAYFFFRSSVSLIFKTLKKRKKGNVTVTDVVFTSSIMHRMKKNAFSLTLIGIISAITITILSFAALGQSSVQKNVNLSSPYEYTYFDVASADKFEVALQQKNIGFEKYTQHLMNVPIKGKTSALGSYFDETPLMRDTELEGIHVAPGEVQFVNMFSITQKAAKVEEGMDVVLGKGNYQKTLKVGKMTSQNYIGNDLLFGSPVAVVDEQTFEQLEPANVNNKEHPKGTQIGYELKQDKDKSVVDQLNHQFNKSNPSSRSVIEKESLQFTGMFVFVSSFLGVAFLVAAGCVIYIKQMDETDDEMRNYEILRKIGYTHQDMTSGLALKTLFNFGLPLIVGLCHAYFAASAFNVLMDSPNLIPAFIMMGIYSLIYAVFAVIAFIHTKRTIKFTI